jgi:hypothetical protein
MRGDRLSNDQALALRRHYARLADLYSERCVDALLDGRYHSAARCERAYRQAASRCRVIGEQMRDDPASGPIDVGLWDAFADPRRLQLPANAGKV